MSRFFSEKFAGLSPYTPGEQPQDQEYVKLNTNESPFPPSPAALRFAAEHTRPLNLYSDPDCRALREALAETYGVAPEQIVVTNGSDEILNFAFMAFCDRTHPVAFPSISYGFYSVFAGLHGIPYTEVPLAEDLSIRAADYCGIGQNVVIANPNAPTGKLLSLPEIEQIVASNPDHVVLIDEAYIDFGGESCLPLVERYENLLVTQTFSKSRSMAGARLGFGVGSRALIQDLNRLRFSTNPYNVNSATLALGLGTLRDPNYTRRNCAQIVENRDYTTRALRELGFTVLESYANFVFARTPAMDGADLYRGLKSKGVLVRHFDRPEIAQFNRITIGTRDQMDRLLAAIKELLEE